MSHLRLLLILSAFVGLGYLAYLQGWLPISSHQPAPSAAPTLGFEVKPHNRRRHAAHAVQPPDEAALASRFSKPAPASKSSASMLGAIPPGSNEVKVPGTATAAGQIPQSFEGCWKATVGQPDEWTFGHGPILKGWTPATHELCFHNSGNTPEVTFSTSAEYPLTSDWVVSNNTVDNARAEVMFAGDNFVVLRAANSTNLNTKLLGILPGPTGVITSLTDLHCTHLPTDKLLVEASTVQRCQNAHSIDCDGDVWIRQSWHTEFSRQ